MSEQNIADAACTGCMLVFNMYKYTVVMQTVHCLSSMICISTGSWFFLKICVEVKLESTMVVKQSWAVQSTYWLNQQTSQANKLGIRIKGANGFCEAMACEAEVVCQFYSSVLWSVWQLVVAGTCLDGWVSHNTSPHHTAWLIPPLYDLVGFFINILMTWSK